MKKSLVFFFFVILSTSIWGQTVINGDLNHDNNLNVTDVTNMISTILGEKDKELLFFE